MSEIHEYIDNSNFLFKYLFSLKREKKPLNLEEIDKYGNTPLLKACITGKIGAIDVLLKFGADINAINSYGQNALTLAIFKGRKDIVELLLKYRSYMCFTQASIIPPICVAELFDRYDLVQYFQNMLPHPCHIKTVHNLGYQDIRMLKTKYEC